MSWPDTSTSTTMKSMRATDSEVMEEFAMLLRQWREDNGYTQQQLAAEIPCSTAMLTRWENAKAYPGSQTVKMRLKQITGIDVDALKRGVERDNGKVN